MKINCSVNGVPLVTHCVNVNKSICRVTGKGCDVKPIDEAANSKTLKEKLELILERVNRGLGEWQCVSLPYCPTFAVPLKEAQAELVELLEEL